MITSAQMNQLDIDHTNACSDTQLAAASLGSWNPLVAATSVLASGTWGPVPAYDTVNARWLAYLGNGSNNAVVAQSIDGGANWATYVSNVFSGFSATAACAAAGNGAFFAVMATQANGNNALYVNSAGSASFGLNLGSAVAATAFYYPTAAEFVDVGGNQTGATFTGFAHAGNSATPTSFTSSLPASWQSGTNHVGAYYSAVGVSDAVVAMAGVTPVTDTARLLHVTFPSSALTFTDITFAALANKIVTGAAYSARDGLWGVLAYDGTNTTLYTTPDPVSGASTWLAAHVFTGLAQSLATIGSVWVTTTSSLAYGGGNPARVMFSGDLATLGASSTWHFGRLTPTFTSGVTGNFLASSGDQLLADNGANLTGSRPAQLI